MKKRILSIILVLAMCLTLVPMTAFATGTEEVGGKTLPYSFNFETDMKAEGWTNIDADGDNQDWITATNIYGAEGWGVEGSRCAISQSYDNNLGVFNADNWLFSPAITIPEGGATVSWYEQSQDVSYPDFYEVYVSETNTSTDTSKMTKIFSGIAANPWNQRSVELEAAEYAGKTVYIAFRHKEYDEFYLEIDNFAVEAVAPPHTHSFTYTVNGGKLTATCTEGCDKGYDTTPLTLTLTAPTSLVYDGNAKAFTFADGEADAWTGAGLELPTFEYYLDKPETPLLDGLDGDPIAAAEGYVVMIRVGVKAAQVEFNIDKATPYIKTTPAPTDIEYGKKLSDSTLFGGYVQISSTDSSEVGGLFEWTNPDTVPGIDDSEITEYDVTFTPADMNNYNTVSCKVKIKVTHIHNLIKVTGQAATETAAGFKDYYECNCGALFQDENGTTPIENLDAWKSSTGNGYLAPLVHTVTSVYDFIFGANQTYITNKNKELLFEIDADYSLFEGKVYVDDILLDQKDYSSEKGSTIIKLKKDYIDSLKVGNHTLKVKFNDGGEAITNFVIDVLKEEKNPKTGDNIVSYLIIGSLSLISLIGCSAYLNRKRFN